eukprot:4242753-Alexandrium_andersonii.AAC.1
MRPVQLVNFGPAAAPAVGLDQPGPFAGQEVVCSRSLPEVAALEEPAGRHFGPGRRKALPA